MPAFATASRPAGHGALLLAALLAALLALPGALSAARLGQPPEGSSAQPKAQPRERSGGHAGDQPSAEPARPVADGRPSPPAELAAAQAQRLVLRYVAETNARDLDALLELYAPQAQLVMRGKPTRRSNREVLGDFLERLERYSAVMDPPEGMVQTPLPGGGMAVDFSIPVRARVLGITFIRRLQKRFELVWDEAGPHIARDVLEVQERGAKRDD